MHIFDARVRGRVESGLEVQKLEDNARQTLVPDTPVQVESPTTRQHALCAEHFRGTPHYLASTQGCHVSTVLHAC